MSRPWMPLYVADYLADTAHLGALESGVYLHLIMHYWLKGGLPNDPVQLAKISRVSLKQFNRLSPIVAPFFGPNWTHKRIDQELEKSGEISKKRRDAVAQRRDRSSTNVPTNVDQLNTQSQSQSQSHIEIKDSTRERRSQARGSRLPADWLPKEHLEEERELEKFRDYWIAQPGQKGVKTDWDATWRNWVRRAAERTPARPSTNRIANAAKEMLDAERSRNQSSWDHPVLLPFGKPGGN
jgi:uncharacterized protein YdaU (DUF1376 family)